VERFTPLARRAGSARASRQPRPRGDDGSAGRRPVAAAAGYGFGAIFTSFPIDSMIKSSGYAHTLVVWGIIQGVIGIVAAQWLRTPPEG